jgi:hypothetical protein
MSERPVVYSASSVSSYQACHLQWWFTYILKEEGVSSEPQRVGIIVHDSAEFMLRELTGWQPSMADIAKLDFYVEAPVADVIDVFRNDILPTYRKPVLIEAEFQLEVNDIPFSGILDAVDQHDVPWGLANILRDLKSTGSRPSPGKYRFNMTGYWMGATDLGYEPDAAQLDWIVRTKTPYYWPEVMEPITEDDIAIFAATLETVAEGVERGNFEPTGLGTWACKSCAYTASCGPYQRYMEVTG